MSPSGRSRPSASGSERPEAVIHWRPISDARTVAHRVPRPLVHGNWPQQLRLKEPAPKGRQDNWRETDHGGKHQ